MKRFGWVLSGVAVLMLAVAAPAAKKDEGARKGKPDKKAKGEKPDKGKAGGGGTSLAAMAKVLNLSEDQKAALKEKAAESKKAMAAWGKGEQGQKFKELMTQLKAAKQAKQTEDVKKLTAEAKELSKARQQAIADAKASVLDVLTDEQKAQWEAHLLSEQVLRGLKSCHLTAEQEAQVREICANEAGAGDPKARGRILKIIADQVLTEEQRGKAKGLGGPKKGGKKDKGGKKGKGGGPAPV